MTKFSTIYDMFFYRIEKDDSFWSLYNVDDESIMNIAKKRAKNYLLEAVYVIIENSETDTNWSNLDEELETFNFDLTYVEKHLLSSIMYERHIERDISMLRAFEVNFTPSDLNVFSPSASRKTFMQMYESVKNENRLLLASYSSRDGITNKRKVIDHSMYDYSSNYEDDSE